MSKNLFILRFEETLIKQIMEDQKISADKAKKQVDDLRRTNPKAYEELLNKFFDETHPY